MKTTDEQILTAVMSYPTNEQAAKSLNMSTSQLYERMSSSDYQKLLKSTVAASLENITSSLRTRLTSAIDVISTIAENEDNPASVRLAAANSLIKHFEELAEKSNIARNISKEANDPLNFDF